jgi:hypothetical protein
MAQLLQAGHVAELRAEKQVGSVNHAVVNTLISVFACMIGRIAVTVSAVACCAPRGSRWALSIMQLLLFLQGALGLQGTLGHP